LKGELQVIIIVINIYYYVKTGQKLTIVHSFYSQVSYCKKDY